MPNFRSALPRRLLGLAAVVSLGAGLALPAQPAAAGDAGAVAAGIIGGAAVGAMIAGSARPAPPPVVYASPPPPAVVYEEPACAWHRERVWDGYAWRVRRVQVCD